MKPTTGKLARLLLILVCLPASLHGEDWRQFRGSDSSGVSAEQNLPTKIDDSTLKWKIDLPGRGVSGPIVVGNRIFLTASSGYRDDQLRVLCFSADTGEQLWERKFAATGRTISHESICMATPQPCSDGERVYAYFSSGDVACLDLAGTLIWYRGLGADYPNASSSLAMSSSPVVVDDTLVLQLDTDSESYTTGLNALTGETRWKLDQAKGAFYCSPVAWKPSADAGPQVIVQATNALLSFEPATGKENWKIEQPCGRVASTTIADDLILAPLAQLTALRPAANKTAAPEIIWSEGKITPDTPTPVAYRGWAYVLKGSVLSCADMATGKSAWQLRLKSKNAYASPLAGNGHLYLIDEAGMAQTIRLGAKKGEIASQFELGEPAWCTPALARGALFVRSDKHLWKFAD
ncbi:MAG: PQQ-binding-like beta-propeller repeat protein [Pirellulales bacterium]